MIQYIILGCGTTGCNALHFLGHGRVYCFASNHYLDDEGNRYYVLGKPVVSFEEMQDLMQSDEYMLVIASENFRRELSEQCRAEGIKKYFIFHNDDVDGIRSVYPGYMLNRKWEYVDYNKALSLNVIEKYKKIVVYGNNEYLPYLITEIINQAGTGTLLGIVPHSPAFRTRSAGFPILSLDSVWKDIDCLVINSKENESAIRTILEKKEHKFDVIDLYDVEHFEPAFFHPEMEKYRNVHNGKRIFLIGNGPSLRIDDLEKLHSNEEICIGFNGIFKIFDKTKWRPRYYCSCDSVFVKNYHEDIANLKNMDIFVTDWDHITLPKMHFKNVNYVHCGYHQSYPNRPRFSVDLRYGVADGGNVMYTLGMQLAHYLGAREIFLLGVDHTDVDEGLWSHFTDDYMKEKESQEVLRSYMPISLNRMVTQRAYEEAERYSLSHDFRIFNATRGGDLNVFERIDFDSLF